MKAIKGINFKRLCAMFLAICMTFGSMGLTAFAEPAQTTDNSDQIMEDWFEKGDADHGVSADTTDQPMVQSPGGKVKVYKTIAPTSIENEFDITLKVETQQKINSTTTYPSAAIALVLDTSGSMAYCTVHSNKKNCDCGAPTRLEQLQKTLTNVDSKGKPILGSDGKPTGFLERLRESAVIDATTTPVTRAHRYIRLITFASSASTQGSGWYDLANDTDYKNLRTKISDLSANGATNLDAALDTANTQMNNFKTSHPEVANLYTVALTDGMPTTAAHHDSDNNSCCYEEYKDTTEAAQTLRNNNNTLFTVCYGAANDTICFGNEAKKASDHTASTCVGWHRHTNYTNGLTGTYNKTTKTFTQCNHSRSCSCTTNWYYTRKVGAFLTDISDVSYAASNASSLQSSFENIEEMIALLTDAWEVTDPMGAQVDMVTDPATLKDCITFDAASETLTWNLKADTYTESGSDSNKTYTYTATYRVKLDTTTENFVENSYYATNKYTSLTYVFQNEKGQIVDENGTVLSGSALEALPYTTGFNVPGVEGEKPTVTYTVQFNYWDRDLGDYVTDEDATVIKGVDEVVKLWDYTYEIKSTDYTKDYYMYDHGDIGRQQLYKDNLIFNLYYVPNPVTVKVNHYLTTTTVTDNGNVVVGPTLIRTDIPETQYFENDEFTANADLNIGTFDRMAIGEEGFNVTSKTINLPSGDTIINIYYTKLQEGRTGIKYDIHYFYRTNEYQIVDGRMALTEGTYVENTALAQLNKDAYYNTSITVPAQTQDGTYTLDYLQYNQEDAQNSYQVTLTSKTSNVINVYYEKDGAELPKDTLTVEHKYYDVVYDATNDTKRVEKTELAWTEYDEKEVRVGEIWSATKTEKTGYTMVTPQADLTTTIIAGDNYILVEYEHEAKASVIVTYEYNYYELDHIDEATGTPVYKDAVHPATPSTDTVNENNHYAGEFYTPASAPKGYTVVSESAAKTLEEGTNTFTMVYELYEATDICDLTVIHHYQTTSYSIVDGEITPSVSSFTESEDKVYGEKNDTIDVAKKTKQDEYTFVKADTEDLKATFIGANGEYNVYYEKEDFDGLGNEIPVKVVPVYITLHTIINENGETETVEYSRENGQDDPLTGPYYLNQILQASVVDGTDYETGDFKYAPRHADNTAFPYTVIAENNVIYVILTKTDDVRVPADVTVFDTYSTVTRSVVNGVVTDSARAVEGPVEGATYDGYYVGQFFDPAGKGTPNGFGIDAENPNPSAAIKLEKAHTDVDFYWFKLNDVTEPASFQVIHHYTIKDVNPDNQTQSWTYEEDVKSNLFAGQTEYAAYDFASGAFTENQVTDVKVDDVTNYDAVNAEVGVVLHSGANIVDIFYEKEIDTRPSTNVTVIHRYYYSEAKLIAEEPVGSFSQNYTKNADNETLKKYMSFTNTEFFYTYPAENGLPYELYGTPVVTIESLSADASENVIYIDYVRKDAGYQIIHEYYLNDVLVGALAPISKTGKVGDVINEESIDRIFEYEGKTYGAPKADKTSITLAEGTTPVITIKYYKYEYDYTVFYFGQGGILAGGETNYADSENLLATAIASYGIEVDENTFTRKNYHFIGWTDEENGAYAAGDVISFIKGGTKTLYANWDKDEQFNVSYSWTGIDAADQAVAPSVPVDSKDYFEADTASVDALFTAESTFTGKDGKTVYKFSGWTEAVPEEATAVSINENNEFAMPARDVAFQGVWSKTVVPATPITPMAALYRAEYYLETGYGTGEFAIKNDETYTAVGEIGSTVSATAKAFTGYTFTENHEDSKPSGVVVMVTPNRETGEPEYLVLKRFYTKDQEFSISYSWTGIDAADQAVAPTVPTNGNTYLEGATAPRDARFTAESTFTGKDGKTVYKFSGWTEAVPEEAIAVSIDENNEFAMPARDVAFQGVWSKTVVPSTPITPMAAAYRVRYFLQAEYGSRQYNQTGETEMFVGELGKEVTAVIKSFDNYIYNESKSSQTGVVVMPKVVDGEVQLLTLDLYYDVELPETFAVIYHDGYNEGAAEAIYIDGYRRGEAANYATFTILGNDTTKFSRTGYTFLGWSMEIEAGADEALASGKQIRLQLNENGELDVMIQNEQGVFEKATVEEGRLILMALADHQHHIDVYANWSKNTIVPSKPEVKEEPVEENEDDETEEITEDIPDGETPLSEAPETAEEVLPVEFEEMPEEDVPLADVPATGDNYVLWALLSLAMAIAMGVMTIFRRKERNF